MPVPSTVVEVQRGLAPTQKSSHVAMAHDASSAGVPPASATSGRVDAIVVPASRGAAALDGAAHLSIRLGVPLVALCSRNTPASEAAARLARKRRCRAVIVEVPSGYEHDLLPRRTSALRFRVASANRRSDLSLKRNLGLLMARLHGWGKILFLDDDIGDTVCGTPVGIPTETARRLAAELDVRQVAGLTCREFPDNSVVCHARRLAGYRQDTFVSGAALGVNCNDQPVPFFPDQYNEDWFFFSPLVAQRNLGLVGHATQEAYDPYQDPQRAREEEFGDLLAEGLYALFEQQAAEISYFRRLDTADEPYWERFIEAWRETLSLTALSLEIAIEYTHDDADADRCAAALRSLDAAERQLYRLSPRTCTDYIDAWASDLREWQQAAQQIRSVGGAKEALGELGLENWHLVGHRSQNGRRAFRGVASPSDAPANRFRRRAISSNFVPCRAVRRRSASDTHRKPGSLSPEPRVAGVWPLLPEPVLPTSAAFGERDLYGVVGA